MPTAYPKGCPPVIAAVSVMEVQARMGGQSPFLGYTVVYMDEGGNTMGAVRTSQSFSPAALELLNQLVTQLERDFVATSSTPLHERDDPDAFVGNEGVELRSPR